MMSVTIDDITFHRHVYDTRFDVLYLSAEGYYGPPHDAYASPEGHGVEWDEDGQIVGMILVNARWLYERDGELLITLADDRQLSATHLAKSLKAAA
jgi:uncharacterized protein YuzE